MMSRMEERERTQQKLQNIKAQAKELEYALKRLLETGTVISPELDEQIQKVISNQNLSSLDEENADSLFYVCSIVSYWCDQSTMSETPTFSMSCQDSHHSCFDSCIHLSLSNPFCDPSNQAEWNPITVKQETPVKEA